MFSVEERGRDGRGGHPELGDEHRHRGGVRDVRLARDPTLRAVRLGGVGMGALHELGVAVRVVAQQLLREPVDVDAGVPLRP